MNIAIIPAYDPDEKLLHLVEELLFGNVNEIIVVNDGSHMETEHIFELLKGQATILSHEKNMGKGMALKTAMLYIKESFPECRNIVMLDADGQHVPKDAFRLLAKLEMGNDDMVLGCRSFSKAIPFKSRAGNLITKQVFGLLSGMTISDTQTGLRAFRSSLIPSLLEIKGERYEYELNMLFVLVKQKIKIGEVVIETIYHDADNSCSHFRAVKDSFRIYGNLLLFSGASFLSFLVDYILFFPMVALAGFLGLSSAVALIAGNIGARLLSAAFNYHLNSTYVFKQKSNRLRSAMQYTALAGVILVLNTSLLYILNTILLVPEGYAKLITEITLFMISFTVQKLLIFRTRKEVPVYTRLHSVEYR
ncbi:MAG: glycosyltransferase [Lachnospiraceae bacterium]